MVQLDGAIYVVIIQVEVQKQPGASIGLLADKNRIAMLHSSNLGFGATCNDVFKM